MEDMVYCKNLHEPIEGINSKPTNMSDANWTKMNRKTIGTIRQWVDESIYHHKKLESLFEKKTDAHKVFLIKELVNVKYADDVSVTEHLNNFQNVINQVATMGLNIKEELLALLLMGSLPDIWETFVVIVNNSASNGVLSMDAVKDIMFNEETRRKASGAVAGQLFVTKKSGKNSCEMRFNGNCHYYGEKGHMKKHYCKWKKEQKDGNNTAGVVTYDEELL
ncbi:hypothetical protein D8674_034157 [Pyrus ussuriensis x Pyrus communis]|uniref:Retrovirus-related Pol polyprotein from transposon TNT 1-94 n=1 Tax=Pyrus ussuriensis x Pyrus communis TaxID=2448454 RepID=A0A5N5HT86_9ROSA|nr:hypothetical protein D8674_034157 [Pyrus ussuriensis x Pyrus communis]